MSEESYNDENQELNIEQEVPEQEQETEEGFTEESPAAEEAGDEALSEEVEIQEKPKPKQRNRVSGKTRINQLYREKSQAEHEAALLRAEVQRLQQLSQVSNNAAMAHYDNNIQLQLDRAKRMKAEAIQNNDVEGQVEADLIMSRTAAQMEALEAYKAQAQTKARDAEYYAQQYQQPQQQPQQQLNEATESWLQDNPWFIPGSAEHDPEMQEEVQAYADSLDRKLRRNGQANKILTDEYFNEINDYIAREFYNDQSQPQHNSRGLTMRPATTRAPVAPVSRRGQPTNINARQQQVRLTAEQREIARLSGLTEKAYILGMIESNQMLKDKGRA